MRHAHILLSMLAGTVPASAQHTFSSWSGFDASRQDQVLFPYASALADLDGDGDVDAAFAHVGGSFGPSSNKVTVIRNQGAGAFSIPVAYTIAKPSRGIIAADFDGDGRVDLVAADTGLNGEGNQVSLLHNTGASFAPAAHFSTGAGTSAGPVGLAAADFDGDGDIDLAAANYGYLGQGSTVALLRNNGAGGFLPPVAFAAGGGPWKLAAGDLDGDGDVDLAVARDARRLSILRNQGGTFAAPEEYTVLSGSSSDAYRQVAVSDVDLDGDLDVLYASNGLYGAVGPVVALYRNPGNGTFAGAESIPLDVFSSSPTDMAVRDVTGDGWPDVLVAEHLAWTLVPGNGAGGFLPARLYLGGEGPIAIDAADMDGDGDLDPAVTNRDSLELTVHWNDGFGNLPVPASYPAGSLGNSMAAGDVDHDGDLDLAVSYGYTGAGGVLVLENQGNGTLGPAQNYAGPRAAMRLKLRDMNGDGWLDLLWADAAPPYDFNVRLNLGNGTFGAYTTWPVHTCGSGDVEAFDIDGDGDLDAFVTQYLGCAGGSGIFKVFICKNHGDATFEPPYILTTYLNTEIIGHGDLDGDGNEDLVLTSDGVEVYLGNGDGSFQPRMMFATDWGAKHMLVTDLSGDGVLDIATYNFGDTLAGSGGESMSILLGNGDGTFQTRVNYYASYSPNLGNPKGISAADLDGDGDLDIFGGNYGSNDFSVYVNQGRGTFAPQVRYGTGMRTLDVVAADFSGDGLVDVAALVGLPPSGLATAIAIVEGRSSTSTIEAYCFGDGSGAACPCANPGGLGRGCDNSSNTGGALLAASGLASLSSDTLLFTTSGEKPSALSTIAQADTQISPVVFGQGLRCAGGLLKRLYTKSAVGGAISAPMGTEPQVHVRSAELGDTISAGSIRYYYVYYRDPTVLGGCPAASTFNSTQSLAVTWTQ